MGRGGLAKPGRPPSAIPGSYALSVSLITLTLVSMLSLAEVPADPSWLLDDEGKPWVSATLLSRAELVLELEVLHARWRGVGGAGAMLTAGFFLFLTGGVFTVVGVVAAISGSFFWPILPAVAALLVGVGLVVWGISDLISIGREQARRRYRIRELEGALVVIDGVTIARF